MRRRDLLLAGLLPFAVNPARAERPVRIGIVTLLGGLPNSEAFWQPLVDRLQHHGYAAGRSAHYDRTPLLGTLDEVDREAVALVARRPDVIVTTGVRETRAALQATSTIPIVMLFVPDAVALGLVPSLTRPGGNLTGINTAGQEIELKRIQLLLEVVPMARKMALLQSAAFWRSLPQAHRTSTARIAAERLGVEVVAAEHEAGVPFGPLFRRLRQEGVAGLSVQVAAEFWTHREAIPRAALEEGLPTIFGQHKAADFGGLLAYSPRLDDLLSRGADLVAMILSGRPVAEMPIELPTSFEFVVNLGVARRLGLTLPPALLARADEVIE